MEDHADAAAQLRDVLGEDVLIVEENFAIQAAWRTVSCMRFKVRSKVDLPQPEGPMKRCYFVGGNAEADVVKSLLGAIEKVEVRTVMRLTDGD